MARFDGNESVYFLPKELLNETGDGHERVALDVENSSWPSRLQRGATAAALGDLPTTLARRELPHLDLVGTRLVPAVAA